MVFFRVYLPYLFNRMRYLNTTQFSNEPTAKPSQAKPRHMDTSAIHKALRTRRTMCYVTDVCSYLTSVLCHSDIN
jgi:hypothetical protein